MLPGSPLKTQVHRERSDGNLGPLHSPGAGKEANLFMIFPGRVLDGEDNSPLLIVRMMISATMPQAAAQLAMALTDDLRQAHGTEEP